MVVGPGGGERRQLFLRSNFRAVGITLYFMVPGLLRWPGVRRTILRRALKKDPLAFYFGRELCVSPPLSLSCHVLCDVMLCISVPPRKSTTQGKLSPSFFLPAQTCQLPPTRQITPGGIIFSRSSHLLEVGPWPRQGILPWANFSQMGGVHESPSFTSCLNKTPTTFPPQ